MNEQDQNGEQEDAKRMKQHIRVPFPSVHFAECAMKSLGVDKPFQDTKNRKTTIRREMYLEVLEDGVTYLNIIFSCDDKVDDGIEINSLRTCVSSSLTNLSLICQTI